MRAAIGCLGLLALASCGDVPQTADPSPAPVGSFVVPMDPGQIACADLLNPAAMGEATQWTLGRLRAAVLAGRRAEAPSPQAVASALLDHCAANPGDRLAAAAASIAV